MIKRKIKSMTTKDVQKFNKLCCNYLGNIDLAQERYLVDAKSIMGIFCLDMEKPIYIQTEDNKNFETYFKEFIEEER